MKNNRDTSDIYDNGPFTRFIAESILSIVYSNDTSVSDSVKLELLFLMILNQDFSTRYYRAIIFDKISNDDSLILSKPIFIIPILFCYYCQSTKVFRKLNYSTLLLEKDYIGLPEEFRAIYKIFDSSLSSIDVSKSSDPALTLRIRNVSQLVKLNKHLIEKYLMY